MASKQVPQPVPRINTPPVSNTPVRVSSPNVDSFWSFGPLTPARSVSPISPAVFSTTPPSLLRTPVEPLSPCRSRPRTDTQGEASIRSVYSSNRMTRTTTPSESRSNTLSPSISFGGGSYHSSDTGNSPYSLSSSEYLTPPQFQADSDKRPYKPRRGSMDSLSMVRKPKRASTMQHDKINKPRRCPRHGRRNHSCDHGKSHSRQNPDHWCLPGCHVAPTAPKGMKELCNGHVGKYKPLVSLRGTTDTYGRVLTRFWSDPAPPVISRRWSSVEVGSHQIPLASTLPPKSVASTPGNRLPNLNREFDPRRLSRPYRSSTFTRGAIDHDIVRTVREKLTIRKAPSLHLQTPTTITLRRASGASGMPCISTVTELLTPANGRETGESTPRPYPISQADMETDTAYLITRKEIDSITELIEANLRRNFRPHNRVSAHPPATPPARGVRSPTFTMKGMVPSTSSPAESSLTVNQANARRSRTKDSLNYLQVGSSIQATSRGTPWSTSQKSTHEVIWEPSGGSPNSLSSLDDRERQRSSTSNESLPLSQSSTTNVTPYPHKSEPAHLPRQRPDKGDAFDPTDATASISEWSWRLPQADIPTIVTSSDSESNEGMPTSEVPPKVKPGIAIRSVASAPDVPKISSKGKARGIARPTPDVEDVIFFPPLPVRKTTNDWYSPLPDIGCSPSKSPSPQSLYNEGIDATGAISIRSPAPKSQRASFLPLTDSPDSSRPNVEFDPDYDLRRKSVVRAHPQSPARLGSQASMGSSIGASSRERRQSSIRPGIQRVQTIDNIHKGKRAGTWTRNRPPSICPPLMTPSPAEISDNDSSRRLSPPPAPRKGPPNRKKDDMSPHLPKMDRVGIYGKITGTVKAALGLDVCKDGCPPKHECDDCARDPRQPSVDWIG